MINNEQRHRIVIVATLIAISSVVGCGESVTRPATVPVTGTVMYNGKPLEGATVSFMAEKSPRAASGVTDAKGEFALSMFKANDGATPGENKVMVVKPNPAAAQADSPTSTPMATDPAKLAQAMQAANTKSKVPRSLIPEKYGSIASTPLKETVTEKGPNQFVIQLTD